MKKFTRHFSRVADSSGQCFLLRPDSPSRAKSNKRKSGRFTSGSGSGEIVPQGHLPVYVGEEMERFVVRAQLLNHPTFIELLKRSAEEYGYEQQGVLKIPCHVQLFKRLLKVLKQGQGREDSRSVEELAHLSAQQFL